MLYQRVGAQHSKIGFTVIVNFTIVVMTTRIIVIIGILIYCIHD